MENYERDDVFFETVNRNNMTVKRDEETASKIAWDVNAYYKNIARAKAAVKRDNEQKRKVERKKSIRVKACAFALLALLGTAAFVAIEHGDDISTAIEERQDFNTAVKILNNNIMMVFHARRLADGYILNDNTMQQYKDLNITTIEEVYMYKYEASICMSKNFEEEFDKLIKSVSYYDEERNICFYTSFENFLEVNGFTEEEFKQIAKNNIIKNYRLGKIMPLPFEGMSTANMSKGKGI